MRRRWEHISRSWYFIYNGQYTMFDPRILCQFLHEESTRVHTKPSPDGKLPSQEICSKIRTSMNHNCHKSLKHPRLFYDQSFVLTLRGRNNVKMIKSHPLNKLNKLDPLLMCRVLFMILMMMSMLDFSILHITKLNVSRKEEIFGWTEYWESFFHRGVLHIYVDI